MSQKDNLKTQKNNDKKTGGAKLQIITKPTSEFPPECAVRPMVASPAENVNPKKCKL
jgi:hypothetical protein